MRETQQTFTGHVCYLDLTAFSIGNLEDMEKRSKNSRKGKKAWKNSRKGKKAWRANISTEDIEDYYEKTTKDALSGGSLADVPGDSLFFVDNSRAGNGQRRQNAV